MKDLIRNLDGTRISEITKSRSKRKLIGELGPLVDHGTIVAPFVLVDIVIRILETSMFGRDWIRNIGEEPLVDCGLVNCWECWRWTRVRLG